MSPPALLRRNNATQVLKWKTASIRTMKRSDAILKRIDFTLSSLHFTTWLPIIVTVTLGLVAITFSIAQLDLASKAFISAGILLFLLGGYTVVFLGIVHVKQDALWEVYTLVVSFSEKVDALRYEELIGLQKIVAEIQRKDYLHKRSYEKLVTQAREIITGL
jgi:hypothetical protein